MEWPKLKLENYSWKFDTESCKPCLEMCVFEEHREQEQKAT